MAIYQITDEGFNRLAETSFNAEKIYERKDLQRLLKSNIEVLSPDLKVIAEEFGEWADSNRRIDLLCLDKDANLVVVEIKRTDDGGHMELQAIRYAAMVSAMTFKQLVDVHAKFLRLSDNTGDEAERAILDFLGWDELNEDLFANEVRIILASADFSREITTSVIWLNQYGIDIRCVRLRPYRMENGTRLVDVQQIIPLPEASDYQTRIRAKEREGKQQRAERYDLRLQFWTGLLGHARTRTQLHANRSPGKYSYIGGSTGTRGLNLNYAVREDDAQAELYIDFGVGFDDKNLQVLNQLLSQKESIEQVFGGELEWEALPGSRGCRIRKKVAGGYRSPTSEWPRIFHQMVSAMINLDKALRPHIKKLNV
jgi:hypothetical protein